jgi:hypothetical protein
MGEEGNMKYFQPSVNINFDLGSEGLVEQFIPNSTQMDILHAIVKGIKENTTSAHMIVGPYGAGKSLIGALTAGVLTKSLSQKARDMLFNKFDYLDEKIAYELRMLDKGKVTFLPVIITGKQGEFSKNVLDAVLETLTRANISFTLPGESKKVVESVENWKLNFPDTYKRFEKAVTSKGLTMDEWIASVSQGNEDEIEWFRTGYPYYTSGAIFLRESDFAYTEQLQILLNQLLQQHLGIYVVYDEFGRFLQGAEITTLSKKMQEIQDVAEMANRLSNFGITLITHTGLRQYVGASNEAMKNELQRVEKRYAIYYVESDPSLFFRTAHHVIEQQRGGGGNSLFLDHQGVMTNLRKYDLFPDLNANEVESIIVFGCEPLHPVALKLLPTLSNILAQNERTLYTFLGKNEKNGLLEHIRCSQDWYYADQLFDYFYPDASMMYFLDELKYYRMANGLKLSAIAFRIVKLMTLIQIANRQGNFQTTTDFLAFTLGIGEEETLNAIEELQEKKFLRYNRLQEQWELYSGSAIDVERLIEKEKVERRFNRHDKLGVISKLFPIPYRTPNDYNSEKSMIRFAKTRFVWSTELLMSDVTYDYDEADMWILYILLEEREQWDTVYNKLLQISKGEVIYCIPVFTIDTIEETIEDYLAIHSMLENVELLASDHNLKRELILRLENVQYEITEFLRGYLRYNQDLCWIAEGKEELLSNEFDLERRISAMMYDIYPLTPEIRNESFNRRNINPVQKRAAMYVLDRLLENPDEKHLGIEGFGPDYMIYASVIKNTGLQFKQLSNLQVPELRELRSRLIVALTERPVGQLQELIQILRDKPFGIRKPLIPLLFVALIRDYWDQFMIYAKDMYVPNVTASFLYQIIDNEIKGYEYRVYEIEEKHRPTIEALNEVFFEPNRQSTKLIVVMEQLLKWLRSLPRFVQITNQISDESNRFKEIIRLGETDPILALDRLTELCSMGAKSILSTVKQELEQFMDENAKNLTNSLYERIGISNEKELIEWLGKQDMVQRSTNCLLIALAETREMDRLAEKIVGVARTNWSDTTQEMFLLRIESELDKLASEVNHDRKLIQIVSENQLISVVEETALSTKSKTIYANAKRMIQSAGRTVPKNELKYVILKILQDIE